MEHSSERWYQKELQKPLEEIKEDIFFRADNFQEEDWYDDVLLYTRIGVCQPEPEHMDTVQKALKILGFHTHVSSRNGRNYLVHGEKQQNRDDGRLR